MNMADHEHSSLFVEWNKGWKLDENKRSLQFEQRKKTTCTTVQWTTISHVPISNLVIEQLLVFNTNSSDMYVYIYIYIYIHIGSCLNTVTVDEG